MAAGGLVALDPGPAVVADPVAERAVGRLGDIALGGGIWDVDADGVASNRRGLFTGGDGMAVDCAGNIYARGIIFSSQGQNIGNYGGGTNLAFGGPDGRSLLIVGPGRNARLVPTNLPGLP